MNGTFHKMHDQFQCPVLFLWESLGFKIELNELKIRIFLSIYAMNNIIHRSTPKANPTLPVKPSEGWLDQIPGAFDSFSGYLVSI